MTAPIQLPPLKRNYQPSRRVMRIATLGILLVLWCALYPLGAWAISWLGVRELETVNLLMVVMLLLWLRRWWRG